MRSLPVSSRMNIEIYTIAKCPYCAAAIRLLEKRKLPYKEFELTDNPVLEQEIVEQTGQKTTPHVFINGKHIGGFDELVDLDQEGALHK